MENQRSPVDIVKNRRRYRLKLRLVREEFRVQTMGSERARITFAFGVEVKMNEVTCGKSVTQLDHRQTDNAVTALIGV